MRREILALTVILLLAFAPGVVGQTSLTYDQQVFDFGNVAIDFNVIHTYHYINATDKPVTISDVEVSCDCSTVLLVDSLIQPGDTAFFKLTFNTRDYYGPTNKSFTVTTDDPHNPQLQYFYLSTVGQWFFGLKPRPISLFFLPGNKAKKVAVPNLRFDEIRLTDFHVADTTFEVNVTKDSAGNGEVLELEVTPAEGLGRGTYLSCVTVKLDLEGTEKPAIQTIPVKIVRY